MAVKSQRTSLSRLISARSDRRSFAWWGGAAVLWWLTYSYFWASADLLTDNLSGPDTNSRLGKSATASSYKYPLHPLHRI